MGNSKLLLLFSYSAALSSILNLTLALDDDVYFENNCSTQGNYTADSPYHTNLNTIISQFSFPAKFNYGFFSLSAGETPDDKVYGIALCRGDRNQTGCYSCLNYTANKLRQLCPGSKNAIAWSEFCLVRYSNQDMYGQLQNDPRTCVPNEDHAPDSDQLDLDAALDKLLLNMSTDMAAAKKDSCRMYEASYTKYNDSNRPYTPSNKTYTYVLGTVYAMMQCSPDMNQEDCNACLDDAISELKKCCSGSLGCRVLRPTCILRFEVNDVPFFLDPVPVPCATSPRIKWIIIVIAAVVGGLVLIIFSICFFSRRRNKSFERPKTVDDIIEANSLLFAFDTILEATNNFSDKNKLGEGGFGAVYKGQLPTGTEIAVKRLFSNSTQGELDFKNEVVLVAKLQHRNLVKLLGFCLERNERLLVFEFVPNSSLDRFIFDPNKRVELKWESRFKIIEGIARGLLYLHQDSRERIIHRDLKPANILLDADMTPKIADFGTARLFGDQTQSHTSKPVGSLGYMPPEYIIDGQFSEKTDVFGFGMIILEIISGQKSTEFYTQNEEFFLNFAWRNWREGTPFNLIDLTLSDGPRNEMMRCINVGLLCVQKDIISRPAMASVVTMLSSSTSALPLPSEPAFLMQTTQIEFDYSGSNQSTTELLPVSRKEA